MSTQLFEQRIIDLNFSFLGDKKKSGVLLTNDFEDIDDNLASPDILFALETAKVKFKADAVYFRHFQDGRASVPQLYLFDYTNKKLTNEEKNNIHIQMWNGYQVPAYIIIEQTSVSIFDSRKRPEVAKDRYAIEILTITGKAVKGFNAKDFDSGIFWDEQNEKNDFRLEQSATRDLIRGLKEVFRSFLAESGLNRHVALKLLVQSLLIKYLEERDVKSASGYFAGTYFNNNFNCSDFCDTIRKGKLLDLLDRLAKDFNGKIFEWDKDEEIEAREAIQQTEIQKLAFYLDGDNSDNQYVIWRLYSFVHLPVEVISSVYEELLTDSKDIVYTPEMIVSTLVDECMPIKNPQKDFKIIDVSCGSGIFLVKTYKRIVQWWRYEQWKKTGKLIKPSLSVLKELLLKSIHGVDIEQDAIRLSIFSLALAVLDEVDLDPPTWEKLKFPDLSKNIITQDFFEFIMCNPSADFDLVIGNPPFNPPQKIKDQIISKGDYFKSLKKLYHYKSEIEIPTYNIALHFLVQSFKLLKKDALLCLIQPAGPVLYQRELDFKRYIFGKYNLLEIIDFTKLADVLWAGKNIATVSVFFKNKKPDNDNILHLIANRTFTNINRLFLEFSHYDFYSVSKDDALNKPYVWKSNLLGGGRLLHLMDRLSELPTLLDYLKRKRKNNNWYFGAGFMVGNKKNKCDFITGQNYIEVDSLTENGIKESSIKVCEIENFESPRKIELYEPPHILIRGIIGNKIIPTVLRNDYLAFPKGIIGIHSPERDKKELMELHNYLIDNNSIIRFYILVNSGRVLIDKATALNNEDVTAIPYLSNSESISLSIADKILISDINKYYFKIKNRDLFNEITQNQIIDYSLIFCTTLNSIYQKEKFFQLFKIIDAGKYYALHFEYTSEALHPILENADDIEKYIEAVIPSRKENQESTHIQKIIKVYGQDTIILAKPKQLRYWLPSIALRDADESFADYVKSRYHNA